MGPFKCRSGACGYGRLCPVLPKVNFNLGDDELPSDGENKAHAFGCALRYLRPELTISSLHISLAYHSFRNSAQLSVFASALRKLKVQDAFTIDGDEKYLEMSFGDLPSNLDMKLMPVNVKFTAYNPTIQYSPGRFLHRYEPEESVSSDTVGAQLAG